MLPMTGFEQQTSGIGSDRSTNLVKNHCPLYSFFLQEKYSTKLSIIDKALMVCLGLEPRAGGWKLQTNPLSYCCIPTQVILAY